MSDTFDDIIRQVLAQAKTQNEPNLLQDELDNMESGPRDMESTGAKVPPDSMVDFPFAVFDTNVGNETMSPIYPSNLYPRNHSSYPVGIVDDTSVMVDAIKRRQRLGRNEE